MFILKSWDTGSLGRHSSREANMVEKLEANRDTQDSILWTHILMMGAAFGLIFPTGMVLGIVKSRFHVPVQIVGTIVAILGYFLGHLHKGRQFAPTAHAGFANWLMLGLVGQVVMGSYLKLHWEKGIHGRIRKPIRLGHSILGKLMPVAAWVQMLFGGIAALGFCRDDHLGQCLAHFIMGSAFIGYGIVMVLMLLVGQEWLRRTGRSQEFFDSAMIAAWGCVNTFTEHRWGGDWVANDIQHTVMGVIWWAAGLLGMWLAMGRRDRGGGKRNFVPGFVIFMTGWGMSGHPQHLMISTAVHTFFGYTLMAAGLTRIIEVAFVLKDKPMTDDGEPNSFQFIPPFVSPIIPTPSYHLLTNLLAPHLLRLSLHGCHRRANGTPSNLQYHPRRLHPRSLLLRVHPLPLRQHPSAHLQHLFCSPSTTKGC